MPWRPSRDARAAAGAGGVAGGGGIIERTVPDGEYNPPVYKLNGWEVDWADMTVLQQEGLLVAWDGHYGYGQYKISEKGRALAEAEGEG